MSPGPMLIRGCICNLLKTPLGKLCLKNRARIKSKFRAWRRSQRAPKELGTAFGSSIMALMRFGRPLLPQHQLLGPSLLVMAQHSGSACPTQLNCLGFGVSGQIEQSTGRSVGGMLSWGFGRKERPDEQHGLKPVAPVCAHAVVTAPVQDAVSTEVVPDYMLDASLDMADDACWAEGGWAPEGAWVDTVLAAQAIPEEQLPAEEESAEWRLAAAVPGTATEVSPRKPEMQDRHVLLPDIARLAHQHMIYDGVIMPVAKPAVYAMAVASALCNSVSMASSIEEEGCMAGCDYDIEHDAAAAAPAAPSTAAAQTANAAPQVWELPSLLTGVFDGHRGCLAAQTAATQLGNLVMSCKPLWDALAGAARGAVLDNTAVEAVKYALKRLFIDVDEEIRHQMQLHCTTRHDGATALMGLQVGQHLFVANAGDSRAVLSRNGHAVRLSRDHTPDLEQERMRIHANGGTVCMYKGAWRVVLDKMASGGGLKMCAVSRAVGDLDYKTPGELISATPDVAHVPLLPQEDHFVIYASDGIWGFVEDQQAVTLVQRALAQAARSGYSRAEQAESAAGALLNEARRLGSLDDITVVITPLDWAYA